MGFFSLYNIPVLVLTFKNHIVMIKQKKNNLNYNDTTIKLFFNLSIIQL
jgi:hypothetical protein